MGRGSAFRPTQTPDLTLRAVQGDVQGTLDQLEDHRRGMVISDVRVVPGDADLAEELIVVFNGPAGKTIKLPKAALRGTGRGQLLLAANQGSGSVTLAPAGRDTLNGTAVLPVNGTAVLWSDGGTQWNEASAYSLPNVGPGAGLIGGGGIASITLDTKGRVTAAVAAVYALAARSLLSTADILLDGVASNTVDLSANRTIGLANAGAGAATYGAANDIITSVTLDAKGRITAVTTENGLITLSAGLLVTTDVDSRRLRATQGTALVAGDFALSAGWGATASISNVLAGTKDSRGEFTVTANGAGLAANPTITLTWKNGAWPSSPFAIVKRNGGTGANTEPTWVASATTLTMTWPNTPVAGLTYTFDFMVLG